jgi:DNA mismatch endonuclease (patch repair protein)
MPRSNTHTHYWLPKLERNSLRDARITQALESAGWTVVRSWEHVPLEDAVTAIIALLASPRH